MANPEVKEKLDLWDYITVILYRLGLLLSAAALIALPWWSEATALLGLPAIALLCYGLHLYMKPMRLFIQLCGWLTLLFFILAQALTLPILSSLSLGAMAVVLSALCFKEGFCFSMHSLKAAPIGFIAFWVCSYMNLAIPFMVLSVLMGLVMLFVSWKKWTMPMHYDIGDKSRYIM